jgi:hypothetical protein
MIMRAVLLCGVVLGLCVPGAAQAEEVVLQPSSKWVLDYHTDKCRIGRTFREGNAEAVLFLEQLTPSNSFSWTVGGSELSKLQYGKDIAVQFGPGFAPFEVNQHDAMTIEKYGNVLRATGYQAYTGPTILTRVKRRQGEGTVAALPAIGPSHSRELKPEDGAD